MLDANSEGQKLRAAKSNDPAGFRVSTKAAGRLLGVREPVKRASLKRNLKIVVKHFIDPSESEEDLDKFRALPKNMRSADHPGAKTAMLRCTAANLVQEINDLEKGANIDGSSKAIIGLNQFTHMTGTEARLAAGRVEQGAGDAPQTITGNIDASREEPGESSRRNEQAPAPADAAVAQTSVANDANDALEGKGKEPI